MRMKHLLVAAPICLIAGCAQTFPENPTPEELDEMHAVLRDCLNGIIPLETDYSRTCQNVESALIAYYGSLDAYLDALKARN
ncbi:hypothetical protein [Pelagibius sp.]|uniref:hypothetical protein n=1 Tax=Pelagibius sp. TaxID=1931238 RepID=UPI00261BC5DC|nr:hypothetical protein [Pelagibius sp.]